MNYKKYLIMGIPILFAIGSIFHFIYEWSGNNFLVGLIAPINESIWEHLKLVLLPMILYWTFYSLITPSINKEKWYFSLFISIITAMLTIVSFYYVYTGAFGIESLVLDIFSLALGISVGHLLGAHFYKYGFSVPIFISLSLLVILFTIFATFTITPPNLPIFMN